MPFASSARQRARLPAAYTTHATCVVGSPWSWLALRPLNSLHTCGGTSEGQDLTKLSKPHRQPLDRVLLVEHLYERYQRFATVPVPGLCPCRSLYSWQRDRCDAKVQRTLACAKH